MEQERPYDVMALGELQDQASSYQHPHKGPHELWYTCAIRKCLVYLCLDHPCMYQDIIRQAMRYALDNDLDGLKVLQPVDTRWWMEYEPCVVKPLISAFNAEYQMVDFSELTYVSSLTPNIDVVKFEGVKYVHKYMHPGSLQFSFEKEFHHYVQIQSCECVPSLIAVVG